MASKRETVGVPDNDPVKLHAREHLRAGQSGAADRRRYVCFAAGCPLTYTKTEDMKRHFLRGWHSDANAGPLAAWDEGRVFTVSETEWLADLGLTATMAATDAASWAAARLTAPAYDANDLADKDKTDFGPRDPTWQPRVTAWKIAKGYKAAPGSVAAPAPAVPVVGGAAVAAALPVAPVLASAGPASSNNTTTTNSSSTTTSSTRASTVPAPTVGAAEAAARAESKRKLAELVAAPRPRRWERTRVKNGYRYFRREVIAAAATVDDDDEDEDSEEKEDDE